MTGFLVCEEKTIDGVDGDKSGVEKHAHVLPLVSRL